jgi:glucose-1-phosphate thymidylyltransferase
MGKQRKGIILAGGTGSRLFPATLAMSKQLLPVYNKPMIYYPLSTLMLAGIRDILIISTAQDTPRFQQLLGSGEQLGLNFTYIIQEKPTGIPDAFILGEEFIGDNSVALILGDNIFYGNMLQNELLSASEDELNSTVFTYQVSDPERYGIVELDGENVLSIEEKPEIPKSNYAVTGLYFYTNNVVKLAKKLAPSNRGETEITDLNRQFIALKRLRVVKLGRGHAWLDTGTHDSLSDASQFIKTIENRQGLKIACIEEIALKKGYISLSKFKETAEALKYSPYGEYLISVAASHSNI